jgi:outer membrane biosynthesis protein TonB
MRRGSRRSFSGLLITIALHGVIFMTVAAAHNRPQEPVIVQREFVQAEMVKLGKKRDPFWLPKKYQPPPPPPPDAIKLSDNADAKAAPVEAPKLEDPKTSKEVKNALARAAKLGALAVPEEPDEGAANGSKTGTSTQAIGDPYIAEIKGLLLQNYNLPAGMNADQIPSPPEIRFRIGTDGTLSAIKLTKTSGNPLVDDACVSAAQLTRRVRPPPPGSKVPGLIVACEK